MKILLDTCSFLWVIFGSDRLSATAKAVFTNPDNEVFASAVSFWEIAVKTKLGKISLPDSGDEFLVTQRERHLIDALPLGESAAAHLIRLPELHRDPFDRMLVCQAIEHGLSILTPDALIRRYPVRTIW